MTNIRRGLMAASGSGGATYVDDVFDTHLWTGTDTNYSITNGLDMDGEGGMVWNSYRSGSNAASGTLMDTPMAVVQR